MSCGKQDFIHYLYKNVLFPLFFIGYPANSNVHEKILGPVGPTSADCPFMAMADKAKGALLGCVVLSLLL